MSRQSAILTCFQDFKK